MKWFLKSDDFIQQVILLVITGAMCAFIYFAPLKLSLVIIFASLFLTIMTVSVIIMNYVGDTKIALIPIDVRTEMMFKHMISEIFALRNEVERIRTMLQMQEIRERQQEKPEEKSGELSSKI